MASHSPLRWGILSAGKVANDFCVALTTLPKEDHVMTHVAARSEEKAKEFAAKFDIEKFSGSYEAVVMDTNVDVVYIASINTKHKELSLLALEHGKAVLCEKPVGLNGLELEEVLKKAEEKNLFFMEAVWTRNFPLYEELRSKATKEGSLGEPMVALATFGHAGLLQYVDRFKDKDMGGSILIDIGYYALSAIDIFFQGYSLIDVKACGHVNNESKTDRSVGITATYEGNRIIQMMCSGDITLPNDVTLICEKGTVKINAPPISPPLCPITYTEDLGNGPNEVKFELPKSDIKTYYANATGHSYEAEHVRQCLIKGLKQSPVISHDTSRRMMRYMDDIRKQIGSTSAL